MDKRVVVFVALVSVLGGAACDTGIPGAPPSAPSAVQSQINVGANDATTVRALVSPLAISAKITLSKNRADSFSCIAKFVWSGLVPNAEYTASLFIGAGNFYDFPFTASSRGTATNSISIPSDYQVVDLYSGTRTTGTRLVEDLLSTFSNNVTARCSFTPLP